MISNGNGRFAQKILVVDDHDDTRKILRIVLEREGYEVSEAATGSEGLRLAFELVPQVVLMDIILPVIDGLDVSRRIRASSAMNGTRIVAMTAMSGDVIREESLLAGCDAFIEKPFALDVVRNIVRPDFGLMARSPARAIRCVT